MMIFKNVILTTGLLLLCSFSKAGISLQVKPDVLSGTSWKSAYSACNSGAALNGAVSKTEIQFYNGQYRFKLIDAPTDPKTPIGGSGNYKLIENQIQLTGWKWAYANGATYLATKAASSLSYIEISSDGSYLYLMAPDRTGRCQGQYSTDAFQRVR